MQAVIIIHNRQATGTLRTAHALSLIHIYVELKANSVAATFTEKSNAIKNEKSKYYKLAIKANPNKVINPILQTTLSFSINDVDEAGMYKFKNTNTNIWYIYNPTSLYCFAYYDDDYILDAYGILDWVNSIPCLLYTSPSTTHWIPK